MRGSKALERCSQRLRVCLILGVITAWAVSSLVVVAQQHDMHKMPDTSKKKPTPTKQKKKRTTEKDMKSMPSPSTSPAASPSSHGTHTDMPMEKPSPSPEMKKDRPG